MLVEMHLDPPLFAVEDLEHPSLPETIVPHLHPAGQLIDLVDEVLRLFRLFSFSTSAGHDDIRSHRPEIAPGDLRVLASGNG